MELAIGKCYEGAWERQYAMEWCRAGIEKAIEWDGLVEGVDYDWSELYSEDGEGYVILRLPLKNRIW